MMNYELGRINKNHLLSPVSSLLTAKITDN
jgi:hypothetical protein